MPLFGASYIRNSGIGFGDGSDGDAVISTAVQWGSTTGVDHTGFVVKQFKNLELTSTGIITPAHRNKGIFLFCRGDCKLSGILSNSLMGSTYNALDGFSKINLRMLPQPKFAAYKTTGLLNLDAYSGPSVGAAAGTAGIDGQCGGGGRGLANHVTGGYGAPGLPFCGGGGGGGEGYCGTGCYTAAQNADKAAGGGPSGDGRWGSGGGGGNPPGNSQDSGYGGVATQAETGNGGAIWIFVRGILTFGATMRITTLGAIGGYATLSDGGGSGGGPVTLMYKKGFQSTPGYIIDTSGGSGYARGAQAGGAGSIRGPLKLSRWA